MEILFNLQQPENLVMLRHEDLQPMKQMLRASA